MALSSMVSKTSPSVVPLALRAISSAGSMHGSIITATVNVEREYVRGIVQSHQFSTVATAKKLLDSSLLKHLRSEIKTADEYNFEKRELPETPAAFPFTIKDNKGERTVTMVRDFPDETIEVEVRKAQVEEMGDEEDETDENSSDDSSDDDSDDDSSEDDNGDDSNDDESSEEEDDKSSSDSDDDISGSDDSAYSSGEEDENGPEEKKEPSLPMSVTVSKKDGRRLKFELDAYLYEIKIKHMSIEESAGSESDAKVDFNGPDFEKLDHNLRHLLLKYLEIRGIKVDVITFLHKYMVAKSCKDDLLWLNKLKKFVKK